MGIKRVVDVQFWTDDKVVDMFSPEDKYFMLYLLTNPHTTQLGIYQLNKKIMAFETGYSTESVTVLLDRFQAKYGMIRYSDITKEVAIKNFLKHSIIKGGQPVEDLLKKEISAVKDKSLLRYIFKSISSDSNLNKTVGNILELLNVNDNQNDNDNDNDNEESYHDSYHDSSKEKKTETNTDSAQSADNAFERFWTVYPKKIGKIACLAKWKKIKPNKDLAEKMINAVKTQKEWKDWTKNDGKFIPHPLTWLNQGRWEDEGAGNEEEYHVGGTYL